MAAMLVPLGFGSGLTRSCGMPKEGGVSVPTSASAGRVGPRIAFDTTSHDFGTVMAGTSMVHLFSVRNTGDQTLVLPNVESTCGCTGAVLKTEQIPPGGSGQVEVRFTAAGSNGPARKSVVVASNDPRAPGTRLEVTAVVVPGLTYEPLYVRLITDDPAYQAIRVWWTGVLASQVKPAVPELRGDPAEVRQVSVRSVEDRKGGTLRRGIEVRLRGNRARSGSALAVLTTGLAEPAELAVPFSWGPSVKLRSTPRPPRTPGK